MNNTAQLSLLGDDIRTMIKVAAPAPTPEGIRIKEERAEKNVTPVWWELEKKLIAEGKVNPETQALAFFCPVYFPGQKMVKAFLDEKDEHGEMVIFPLPAISDSARIKVGINYMRDRLGLKNPEKYLEKRKGETVLPIYSSLPGIEGVGSDVIYPYIGWEAVMRTAFQIVPKEWLNAGDPYNQSYRL